MNGLDFLVSHEDLVKKHLRGEIIPHLADSAITRSKEKLYSYSNKPFVFVSDSRKGRANPSSSGVQFKHQQDFATVCLGQWSHQQKCCFLEELLHHSSNQQIQLLHTILLPSLHRDFMYTMCTRFPEIKFSPVSTYFTRRLKKRLNEMKKLKSFYRLESTYVQKEEDMAGVKFPPLIHDSFPMPDKRMANLEMLKNRIHKNQVQEDNSQDGSQSSSFFLATLSKITQQNKISFSKKKSPHSLQANKSTSDISQVTSLVTLPPDARKILSWYTQQWNDLKRNEFLEHLIISLDPRQIYFVSKFLSFKNQKDIVGLLPEKLALKILSNLSVQDLLRACKVNRCWNELASSNEIWKQKCQKVTIFVPMPAKPNWKHVYCDNVHLRYNWDNARYKALQLFGHTQSVQCITCHGNKIATGSGDQTIRIWDISTGAQEQIMTGHSKGVWCLQFFTEHLLISGSFDSTIKMWNLRTGMTTRTLLGHKSQIWCLKICGTLMVSGSQDKTAKLWNVDKSLLVQSLTGHTAAVFSVDLSEDCQLILTAAGDKTVRLWDSNTGQCTKCVWVSPNNTIMTISHSHGYFVCAYDTTLCLYKGIKLIRTFNEHRKRVESVKLIITDPDQGEGYLVTAGQEGFIKYWSITEEKSIQTFSGHSQAINCIYVNEMFLATASSDKTAKIWNFNVGADSDD